MSSHRTLVVTHRIPFPPDRGDRIRAYHLLRFLAPRTEVHLACLTDDGASEEQRSHLSDLCKSVHIHSLGSMVQMGRAAWSLSRGRAATQGAFFSRAMRSTLRRLSSQYAFDAAVLYCSSMGTYLSSIRPRPPHIVLDLVDLDSQKWHDYADASSFFKRRLYRLEARRVHRLEQRLIPKVDWVTLVSKEECELFAAQHPGQQAVAIVNGVDTNYFSRDAQLALDPHAKAHSQQSSAPPASSPPLPRRLVFVGVMDYRPNVDGVVWFCENVWPLLRSQFPEAALDVVGRNPVPSVLQFNRQAGVNVTGAVPDVRPYLQRATLAVAPLQIARGIQNKVLEALSFGLPVVASPQAATGLHGTDGIVIASSPDEWFQSIARLFRAPDEAMALGDLGRAMVVRLHSWEAQFQPFASLLQLPSQNAPIEEVPTRVGE
jgi:polysaccharide biosynthesis protein PslH